MLVCLIVKRRKLVLAVSLLAILFQFFNFKNKKANGIADCRQDNRFQMTVDEDILIQWHEEETRRHPQKKKNSTILTEEGQGHEIGESQLLGYQVRWYEERN